MLRFLVIVILAAAALSGPLEAYAIACPSAAAHHAPAKAAVSQGDHMTMDGGCSHCPHHHPHHKPCCPAGLCGCCAACSATLLPPPTSPSFGVDNGARVRLSLRVDSSDSIIHGVDPPVPRAAA